MWNGAFFKHRLYTGDIKNHISVRSFEPMSEEPEGVSDYAEVGGGEYAFLVAIGFNDGDGTYEFIVYSDEPEPSEDSLLDEVAQFITT
jgi:hypothetical protein